MGRLLVTLCAIAALSGCTVPGYDEMGEQDVYGTGSVGEFRTFACSS